MQDDEPITEHIAPLWLPEYACGHTEIDEAHIALFLRLEELRSALLHAEDSGAVLPAFNALVKHCGEHFAREEAILKAIGYQELSNHSFIHQTLLLKVQRVRDQYALRPRAYINLATSRLFELVVLHLIVEDRKYFPALAAALAQQHPDSQGTQQDEGNHHRG